MKDHEKKVLLSVLEKAKSGVDLDGRLYSMVSLFVSRRLKRNDDEADMACVLTQLLGDEQAKRAIKTYRTVRNLRLGRAAVGCSSTFCQRMPRMPGLVELPKRERMPLPVKNLFFNTRLMNVVDRVPRDQWPSQAWNDLIDEAETHVNDYLDWTEKNTVNT